MDKPLKIHHFGPTRGHSWKVLGMTEQQPDSPKQRLLRESARIFGEKGFAGASVREICKAADTSSNMIHHYFGSKQGLYDAVLSDFSEKVFEVPVRVIQTVPSTRAGFAARLEIFFQESLYALLENRHVYEMVHRERLVVASFLSYNASLIAFLEGGKELGLIRQDLDCEMLTGLILDRIGAQIYYADPIKHWANVDVLNDKAYQDRWVAANLDLFLNGALEPEG